MGEGRGREYAFFSFLHSPFESISSREEVGVEGNKKHGKKGRSIRDPQRIVGQLEAFHSSGRPNMQACDPRLFRV